MHRQRLCEGRKWWTRAACIWTWGTVSIWKGGVSLSLPPAFPCSLYSSFLLKPATCIMTKIYIPVQKADGLFRGLYLQWVDFVFLSACTKKHLKKQAGFSWSSMFHKAHTVIWVTSHTFFPTFPAGSWPRSCRDLRLHAESLRLKIDAHLPQQHGSSSAR